MSDSTTFKSGKPALREHQKPTDNKRKSVESKIYVTKNLTTVKGENPPAVLFEKLKGDLDKRRKPVPNLVYLNQVSRGRLKIEEGELLWKTVSRGLFGQLSHGGLFEKISFWTQA